MSLSLINWLSSLFSVTFDLVSTFNTGANFSFEASNLDTIKRCTNSKFFGVLYLCESQEFTVESTFFAPKDLILVRVTFSRVYSTHMTTKSLPTGEILIACITVVLRGLSRSFSRLGDEFVLFKPLLNRFLQESWLIFGLSLSHYFLTLNCHSFWFRFNLKPVRVVTLCFRQGNFIGYRSFFRIILFLILFFIHWFILRCFFHVFRLERWRVRTKL